MRMPRRQQLGLAPSDADIALHEGLQDNQTLLFRQIRSKRHGGEEPRSKQRAHPLHRTAYSRWMRQPSGPARRTSTFVVRSLKVLDR